ncbi:MAG: hypothetical protein HON46_08250 [Gammaproteobacteria bacterium]|nr:hypothetical protein [Gammaproteobacteria bacterium]
MIRDKSLKIKLRSRSNIFWQSTIGVLFRPKAFFSQLKQGNHFRLTILLQLIRWTAMCCVTMPHFYLKNPPSLFPVPFGIELQQYRFFEIFAYFPYGLFIIVVITNMTWLYVKKYTPQSISISKVWEVIAIAYFAPWLPTLVLDNFLLTYDLAIPFIIVPLHFAVVGIESALVAIGLQQVFNMPANKAWLIGLGGGFIFLALAGIVVR